MRKIKAENLALIKYLFQYGKLENLTTLLRLCNAGDKQNTTKKWTKRSTLHLEPRKVTSAGRPEGSLFNRYRGRYFLCLDFSTYSWSIPYNAEDLAKQHQVPFFFESLVWWPGIEPSSPGPWENTTTVLAYIRADKKDKPNFFIPHARILFHQAGAPCSYYEKQPKSGLRTKQ